MVPRVAFGHRVNRRGAHMYVVHANQVNLSDLKVGDPVLVNYQPYQVAGQKVVLAGEEDLNLVGAAGQKVLVSCLGEPGNWHSRIFIFLEPVSAGFP